MAYTVDWIAKRVTIPLADLTLVSGSNYTLTVADVHNEMRRLEWTFVDGLWALHILEHKETLVLSGISKTRTIVVVNGYTWDINASNIIVSLIGIDSNLLDTFVPANGVSVLANNSVGKQDVGSSVTAQDKLDIGAQSASDVFSTVVENAETFLEQIRLIRAEAAGSIIVPATGKQDVLSADGLKKRIEATSDATGRTIDATDVT